LAQQLLNIVNELPGQQLDVDQVFAELCSLERSNAKAFEQYLRKPGTQPKLFFDDFKYVASRDLQSLEAAERQVSGQCYLMVQRLNLTGL